MAARRFRATKKHAGEPNFEKKCGHIVAAFWRPLTQFSLWWGPKNGRYFFPGLKPAAKIFGKRPVIKMMLLMLLMSMMLLMPRMPLMPLMPTMSLMCWMFLMPLMFLIPLMLLMLFVSRDA